LNARGDCFVMQSDFCEMLSSSFHVVHGFLLFC
jgi:hypothetical protein